MRPRAPGSLRLCLLSQSYGQAGAGGIAIWTEALAQGLIARGHEATVITRTEAEACVVYQDGVWVHALSAAQGEPGAKAAWAAGLPRAITKPAWAAYDEVRRIQSRRAFDLAMGPIWDLEPLALLALGPIPTAVSLHTTYAQSLPFHAEWQRDSLYRVRHVNPVIAGERRLLVKAPLILANSRAVLGDVGATYALPDLADRAVIIPHGLPDLSKAVPLVPPHLSVEVLFVGRLEPRKGIDILLEAALIVLAETADVRFVVVGEDVAIPGAPLRRETFVQKLAGAPFAQRVMFLGRVSQAELLRRYAAADLVVTPSRYESFGLTLVEAMIFAKPCIATAVGGMVEVVRDGETGLLIPPDNPAALAQAILTLARNPDLRRRMGEAGRRRYEALFTADRMVEATEAAFLQLKSKIVSAPGASPPGLV